MKPALVLTCAALSSLIGGCASQTPTQPSPGASPSPAPSAPPARPSVLVFAVHRSELVAYLQDPVDGSLSLSARTTWSTRWMPQVDPTGRFLFMSTGNGNEVTSWRVRPDGAVTPATRSQHGPGTLHPAGRFGYSLRSVVGPIECEVEGRGTTYAVDPADGAVSELRDSFVTGVAPRSLAFGAGGRFAYVANSGDPAELYGPCPAGSLTGYSVDSATGRLTSLGAAFAKRRAHRLIESDAGGQRLFVVQRREYGNELRPPSPAGLTVYQVDPGTGGLGSVPQGFFELDGYDPLVSLTVDPLGRMAFLAYYTPDEGGRVVLGTLQVGAQGELTPLGAAQPWSSGASGSPRPWSLEIAPDGRFAYVYQPAAAQLLVLRLDPARGLLSSDAPSVALGPDALGVVVGPVPE